MSPGFGIIIESVVAVLLVITIGYCFLLDRRLKRLKADEQVLKTTIADLVCATDAAERATAGLKLTVEECDDSLGRRLKVAEAMSANIGRQIAAGEQVVNRLAQIAGFAKPAESATAAASSGPVSTAPAPPASELTTSRVPAPDARATAAAAQAFAARARLRAKGAAA